MTTSSRLVHCTFPKELIREPLLYVLGRDFEVVPNIRGASISDDLGLVYLELQGAKGEIDRAVSFLKEKGVQVDDVPDGLPGEMPSAG